MIVLVVRLELLILGTNRMVLRETSKSQVEILMGKQDATDTTGYNPGDSKPLSHN